MKDSSSAVREKSVGGKLLVRARANLPGSLKATVQLDVAVVDHSQPGEHFSAKPSHLFHMS